MAEPADDMRDNYDFSEGVKGKYVAQFRAGSNIVVLDPDVAKRFKTSTQVNDALRQISDEEATADESA